ncbi:hypothetical protein MYX78_12335, partial [Acidobacteria bacterium AH-259-G07]|nr:hypothetical protein [Acidobacteria bacterium AH-259-G07]
MGSQNRDLRSELQNFDGTFPESWKPDIGDILVGTLVRYDSGYTDYGEYLIAVIQDDETGEKRSVWLLHEVLRS